MNRRETTRRDPGIPAATRSGSADDLGYGPRGDCAEPNVITAHGSGERRVSPDIVTVALGVEAQATTLEEARSGAAEKTQAFLAAVRALGLAGLVLETARIGLYPVHATERSFRLTDSLPEVVGYRAHSSVLARLRGLAAEQLAAQASRIVDTATQAGANKVEGVQFGLEKPDVAAREALTIAVADARAKAEALARAAGTSVGALYSLNDSDEDRFGSGMAFQAAGMSARSMSASTPVEAGEIVVRRQVIGRWYAAAKPSGVAGLDGLGSGGEDLGGRADLDAPLVAYLAPVWKLDAEAALAALEAFNKAGVYVALPGSVVPDGYFAMTPAELQEKFSALPRGREVYFRSAIQKATDDALVKIDRAMDGRGNAPPPAPAKTGLAKLFNLGGSTMHTDDIGANAVALTQAVRQKVAAAGYTLVPKTGGGGGSVIETVPGQRLTVTQLRQQRSRAKPKPAARRPGPAGRGGSRRGVHGADDTGETLDGEDAMAAVVEGDEVGSLALVRVAPEVGHELADIGRAVVRLQGAGEGVHGDDLGALHPLVAVAAISGGSSFLGTLVAALISPFLSRKMEARASTKVSGAELSTVGSANRLPSGRMTGVYPAGAVADNEAASAEYVGGEALSADGVSADDLGAAVDELGAVAADDIGASAPPSASADAKKAIEAIVRAIPDANLANGAMMELPPLLDGLIALGVYATPPGVAAPPGSIDATAEAKLSPKLAPFAQAARVSFYRLSPDAPLARECGCTDCKAQTAAGKGGLPCPSGCTVSGCGCGTSGVAANDAGAEAVGWVKQLGKWQISVTKDGAAPPVVPGVAPGAPVPAGALAPNAPKPTNVKGAEGEGVGAEQLDGEAAALEGVSAETVEGWGDDVFKGIAAGGGAVTDVFVPGGGRLLKMGAEKIKAKVDRDTGHDPGDGSVQPSVKGVEGMTHANAKVNGEAADVGALGGKPQPQQFGARWDSVRRGYYFFPTPKNPQLHARQVRNYRSAVAAWNQRNAAYARGSSALTPTVRRLQQQLADGMTALRACQAQGAIPGIDDSYATDDFSDDADDDVSDDDMGRAEAADVGALPGKPQPQQFGARWNSVKRGYYFYPTPSNPQLHARQVRNYKVALAAWNRKNAAYMRGSSSLTPTVRRLQQQIADVATQLRICQAQGAVIPDDGNFSVDDLDDSMDDSSDDDMGAAADGLGATEAQRRSRMRHDEGTVRREGRIIRGEKKTVAHLRRTLEMCHEHAAHAHVIRELESAILSAEMNLSGAPAADDLGAPGDSQRRREHREEAHEHHQAQHLRHVDQHEKKVIGHLRTAIAQCIAHEHHEHAAHIRHEIEQAIHFVERMNHRLAHNMQHSHDGVSGQEGVAADEVAPAAAAPATPPGPGSSSFGPPVATAPGQGGNLGNYQGADVGKGFGGGASFHPGLISPGGGGGGGFGGGGGGFGPGGGHHQQGQYGQQPYSGGYAYQSPYGGQAFDPYAYDDMGRARGGNVGSAAPGGPACLPCAGRVSAPGEMSTFPDYGAPRGGSSGN